MSYFNSLEYWNQSNFVFKKLKFAIKLDNVNVQFLSIIEPLFDLIICSVNHHDYIQSEKKYTKYDLEKKFSFSDDYNIIFEIFSNNVSINDIVQLKAISMTVDKGIYLYHDIRITIKDS